MGSRYGLIVVFSTAVISAAVVSAPGHAQTQPGSLPAPTSLAPPPSAAQTPAPVAPPAPATRAAAPVTPAAPAQAVPITPPLVSSATTGTPSATQLPNASQVSPDLMKPAVTPLVANRRDTLPIETKPGAGLHQTSIGVPRTLAEALAATYANQPLLQAERAKVRATDENVPAALAGWRPTVQFAGSGGYVACVTRCYSYTLRLIANSPAP